MNVVMNVAPPSCYKINSPPVSIQRVTETGLKNYLISPNKEEKQNEMDRKYDLIQ